MNLSMGETVQPWDVLTKFLVEYRQDMVTVPVPILRMRDGDYKESVILWHIVFWHLPNKDGRSKLRVEKNGNLWLAMPRSDWSSKFQINPRKADRAISSLVDDGLVEKTSAMFDGKRTTLLSLLRDNFALAYINQDKFTRQLARIVN